MVLVAFSFFFWWGCYIYVPLVILTIRKAGLDAAVEAGCKELLENL